MCSVLFVGLGRACIHWPAEEAGIKKVDIIIAVVWSGVPTSGDCHGLDTTPSLKCPRWLFDSALVRLQEPNSKVRRYRALDALLQFLKTL